MLQLKQGRAFIVNYKQNRVDRIPVSEFMLKYLAGYMKRFKKPIDESGDYLVFRRGRDKGHISENSMRSRFRDYLSKADLNEVIAEIPAVGKQCYGRVKKRKLYRLTTHSLRHTYITDIYENTHDPIVTQRLARHKSLSSTLLYINCDEEKLRGALDNSFSIKEEINSIESFDDPEFMEFMKFYRMWKKMK